MPTANDHSHDLSLLWLILFFAFIGTCSNESNINRLKRRVQDLEAKVEKLEAWHARTVQSREHVSTHTMDSPRTDTSDRR